MSIIESKPKPGTQIIYIPNHRMKRYKELGEMNFGYPNDSQPGFVVGESQVKDAVFCRYWRITHTQDVLEYDLRTKANAELTPIANLVAKDKVPQEIVTSIMAELGYVNEIRERIIDAQPTRADQ